MITRVFVLVEMHCGVRCIFTGLLGGGPTIGAPIILRIIWGGGIFGSELRYRLVGQMVFDCFIDSIHVCACFYQTSVVAILSNARVCLSTETKQRENNTRNQQRICISRIFATAQSPYSRRRRSVCPVVRSGGHLHKQQARDKAEGTEGQQQRCVHGVLDDVHARCRRHSRDRCQAHWPVFGLRGSVLRGYCDIAGVTEPNCVSRTSCHRARVFAMTRLYTSNVCTAWVLARIRMNVLNRAYSAQKTGVIVWWMIVQNEPNTYIYICESFRELGAICVCPLELRDRQTYRHMMRVGDTSKDWTGFGRAR